MSRAPAFLVSLILSASALAAPPAQTADVGPRAVEVVAPQSLVEAEALGEGHELRRRAIAETPVPQGAAARHPAGYPVTGAVILHVHKGATLGLPRWLRGANSRRPRRSNG